MILLQAIYFSTLLRAFMQYTTEIRTSCKLKALSSPHGSPPQSVRPTRPSQVVAPGASHCTARLHLPLDLLQLMTAVNVAKQRRRAFLGVAGTIHWYARRILPSLVLFLRSVTAHIRISVSHTVVEERPRTTPGLPRRLHELKGVTIFCMNAPFVP